MLLKKKFKRLKKINWTWTKLKCVILAKYFFHTDNIIFIYIFRFESVHIDLDRLFSSLNKVLPSKLQRIVVKCDYEHSTKLWPLEKMLRRNTDIILLVILVSKYNRHQINKLQELINEYKDHNAKIYVAKVAMNPDEDIIIPEAHKDILYFNTNVSVLHFSDY